MGSYSKAITHHQAQRRLAERIVAKHTPEAIKAMAVRGRDEPGSLSEDEVKAVGAFMWLQQMSNRH